MDRGAFLWVSEWVALEENAATDCDEWFLEAEKTLDCGAANNVRVNAEIQIIGAIASDEVRFSLEASNNPEPASPYRNNQGGNWSEVYITGTGTVPLERGTNTLAIAFDGSNGAMSFLRAKLVNLQGSVVNVRVRLWVSLSE